MRTKREHGINLNLFANLAFNSSHLAFIKAFLVVKRRFYFLLLLISCCNILATQAHPLTASNDLRYKLLLNAQRQEILNEWQNSIQFTQYDFNLISRFIYNLKEAKGEWASHGVQRIIRLNSECSNSFVSLRRFRIRADIPLEEAFRDPYTLIEKQVYRKLAALKAKQLNKYLCFSPFYGQFVLKDLNDLDKYCIFFYSTQSPNQYRFFVGSNKHVSLGFDKFGKMINYDQPRITQNECSNQTNLLNVHTKLTDIMPGQYAPLFVKSRVVNFIKRKNAKSFELFRAKSTTSTSTTTTTTTTTTSTTPSSTTARIKNMQFTFSIDRLRRLKKRKFLFEQERSRKMRRLKKKRTKKSKSKLVLFPNRDGIMRI